MSYFKWLAIITGISALIVISAFGIKYLRSQKNIKTPTQSLSQTTPSLTPKPVANLESCDFKKEDNPLVNDLKTLTISNKKVIVGTFRGNINSYALNSDKVSAKIDLISPKGEQSHTFSIKDEKGLVYDAVSQKDLTVADLKPGLTVEISFNCFPENNNIFKLTRINITGGLH